MRNNYQIDKSQDSVSKISRSKSKNQLSINAKLKEKVYQQIIQGEQMELQVSFITYSRVQLPQLTSLKLFEKQVQNSKQKVFIANQIVEMTSAKQKEMFNHLFKKLDKVSNKPNPRKNEERIKEAINKAFSDLKTLWYEKVIPACHMELMTRIFNRQNYPMKILEDIKHEFSQITKQTSLIQKAMASVVSREGCIQKIDQLAKQYESGQLSKIKIIKLLDQKISHLRILTIHCIECIYQWKQTIQATCQKKIKANYVHQGKFYFTKIIDDFKKIACSKFSEIYSFQESKSDPFFLNYTFQGKKVSNVSKNLIKRIRLCQIMLVEEDSKQQQTKRTPLIQKIKVPPSMKDKSMPPRMKTESAHGFKKILIEYSQFGDYFAKLLEKSSFSKSFLSQVEIGKFEEITVFQFLQTEDQIAFASDRFSSQRKIVILGVKSTLESVESFLKSFCQHIWEHDNATQIRVSLVHHQIGDNLSVDTQFQKRLKAVGFRWISVNHNNDIRMTVFAIKRPLDTVAHKTARRKQAYPVIIEHLTAFSLEQNNDKKFPNKSQACVLTVIQLLKNLKRQQYQQVCLRDEYFSHLQAIKKIADYQQKQALKDNLTEGFDLTFTYSGLKAFEIDNKETIQKIFKPVQISPKIIGNTFPQFISLFNTSFKFGTTTISDGKYTKFFPNKDSEILICQSNYPIYILQSDEQCINFFIIQVQEGFSMQSVDNIFHAMGQQSSFIDQFWLPNFTKSSQYSDEVGLKNCELLSTDYWTCLGSLTRKSRVRTKVIKPPFVFGVIHKKLLEMLEVPLFYTLIGKQNVL